MKLLCHVFTTLDCNLNCGFCYVDANRKLENNENRLVEIANYLNQKSVAFIHLEGGEPFINDNIFDFITVSRHNNITSIVTNATCITKARIQRAMTYGVNKYIVSVDGLEKVHNMLRQRECFCKVLDAVKMLIDIGADVAISMTLVRDNISQMKKVVEYFSQVGIKKFRFGDVLSLGRTENNAAQYCLDEDAYAEVLEEYLDIVAKYELDLNLSIKGSYEVRSSAVNLHKNNYSCSNDGAQIAFLFNGDAYSCSNMICYDEYYVGNVSEKEKIDKHIQEKKLKRCIIDCKGHLSIAP